jgi:ribokinase
VSTADAAAPLRACVVGDVMVDVLVEVLDARAHASDTPSRIATSPGGAAANQCAWLAATGVPTSLVAAVGDDPFGDAALAALRAGGVDVDVVQRVGAPTGTVVALVEPDGQRSMLTDRGANLALEAGAVEAALRECGPSHVHVSGYALLGNATRAAGGRALAVARTLGATCSSDASSVGPLRSFGAAAFLALVAGADWFFCNLEEGRLLSSREAPDDVAVELAGSFGEVVVTLGADGAVVAAGGRVVARAAAVAAPVADTVGAGDGVAGTYLGRRLLGDDAPAALTAGVAAAAGAVGAPGARRWTGYSRT